jgi:deoxyribose-phosphate aldolase
MAINQFIEHTNLKPTLTENDVDILVAEAKAHQFLGICVPPFWVKRAFRELANFDLRLITVIGFPLGYQMTEVKLKEMEIAIGNGANELDLVMNISSFKTGLPWTKIEIAKCAKTAHEADCVLKVIIETAYLNNDEIVTACKICSDAGVDFVKTSTGFAASGAKKENIHLMRKILPSNVGIKASGGIKTLQDAQSMIAAGADRLGTSSGVAIMKQLNESD